MFGSLAYRIHVGIFVVFHYGSLTNSWYYLVTEQFAAAAFASAIRWGLMLRWTKAGMAGTRPEEGCAHGISEACFIPFTVVQCRLETGIGSRCPVRGE